MKNDMCRICSTYWRDDTAHATFESEMSKEEIVVRYEHEYMGDLLYRHRRSRAQDCGMDRGMNMSIWETYCTDTGEVGHKIAEWIEVTQDIAQLWVVLNVVMRVHVSRQAGNLMGT